MKLTMSEDAQGDGAWGTILNRLKGFTFEVTRHDQTFFVGRIVEADELEVTFWLPGPEREMIEPIAGIDEMEYL